MKSKAGDVIKIDLKKLTQLNTGLKYEYYLGRIKTMLKESRSETLYVSKTNKDGTLLNVRAWSGDTKGDVVIPHTVVTAFVLTENKTKVYKQNIVEIAKKVAPNNIKAGDYVQLEGKDIMGMIDGSDILKAMKKTMNILFVQDVKGGMLTITPYKFNVNKNEVFEVPVKFVRWKLENVEQD